MGTVLDRFVQSFVDVLWQALPHDLVIKHKASVKFRYQFRIIHKSSSFLFQKSGNRYPQKAAPDIQDMKKGTLEFTKAPLLHALKYTRNFENVNQKFEKIFTNRRRSVNGQKVKKYLQIFKNGV